MPDGWIYALVDPRIRDRVKCVRYVGRTSQKLGSRLTDHLTDHAETHKGRWIRKMLRDGVTPVATPIERCSPDRLLAREVFWVRQYRLAGARLVNSTDGGDGVLNLVPDVEARRRSSLRIAYADPERRERTATRLRALGNKWRANPDAMAWYGRFQKRLWSDPQYRARMKAAHGMTPEKEAAIIVALSDPLKTYRGIARELQCSHRSVLRIARRIGEEKGTRKLGAPRKAA